MSTLGNRGLGAAADLGVGRLGDLHVRSAPGGGS